MESRFEQQQADPSRRMYKSNLMVRNIRPDPDDIDKDDFDPHYPHYQQRGLKAESDGVHEIIAEFPKADYDQRHANHSFSHKYQTHSVFQADPDDIDDNIMDFPEEEYNQSYSRQPLYPHHDGHYSTQQQVFTSTMLKNDRLSQSDINDEGATSTLDQLSEFERKLNRNIRPFNQAEDY